MSDLKPTSNEKDPIEPKFKKLSFNTIIKKPCDSCGNSFDKSLLKEFRSKLYCEDCFNIIKEDEKRKREEKEKTTKQALAPQPQIHSDNTVIMTGDVPHLQQLVDVLQKQVISFHDDSKITQHQVNDINTQLLAIKDQLLAVKDQVITQQAIAIANIKNPTDLQTDLLKAYNIPSNLTYNAMTDYINTHIEIPKNVGYFLIRMKREYKSLQNYYELIQVKK